MIKDIFKSIVISDFNILSKNEMNPKSKFELFILRLLGKKVKRLYWYKVGCKVEKNDFMLKNLIGVFIETRNQPWLIVEVNGDSIVITNISPLEYVPVLGFELFIVGHALGR